MLPYSEKGRPDVPPESERLAQIIDSLVQAGSELQAYRTAQTDHPHSIPLQDVSTYLRVAIGELTRLNPARKEPGQIAERDVPSADYLRSLRKRAEQTWIGKVTDVEGLTMDDIRQVIHELEVHQVELRMQNEELIRVQLELENSRNRFSNLFDLAPVGYCILDRRGRILEANTTLCQLLGVSRNELIQTPIQGFILREDQDSFFLYQKAVHNNEHGPIAEIRMVKKAGESFFAQLESRLVQGHEDQLWLVVSDISSLKRSEEIAARHTALAAAHADLEIEKNRYQDLFDFAPDGYFVTDESGTILDVNQAGADLLRLPKDQLIGVPLDHYIFEEEKASFQGWVNGILEKKKTEATPPIGEWELRLNPVGREPFPAAMTAVLLQEKPDSLICIRWLVRDVTARKKTEADLGKNMARFHALFEESSLGIRLLDLQGNTITSNEATQEILGYSQNELRQIPFTQLTDPLDRTRDEGLFRSVLSGIIDRYTIEKRCIHKDGKQVWVHQVVFLVRDAADAPSFLVAMTENISERIQMERELAEIRRLLIDSPEAERLMLSQELHDGPMQELYGVFYRIKGLEENLTGADREILSGSIETIQEVIHVLRGFAGQLRPPTLQSFGLEKTIRSHADQFRKDYPEITLSLELMPDGQRLPERVSLALFRIYQQSLANIVRHAVATQIAIRLILEDECLRLEIADDGKGFEVPPRLVNLMQNGHFGLVGAAERAEAIGGKLTIDSKPGKGTTVYVEVDLARARL